jgi:hypothetical protein
MNAPVIGASAVVDKPGDWSMAFSWRYQKSDRHFTGTHEDTERQAEGSQVINHVNLLELAFTRTVTNRWSFSIGIPYAMMERSNAIRDPSQPPNEFGNSPVAARTITQARGIGDVTFVPHWWAWDPVTHPNGNLSLGFGIKLPTGDNNVQDTRQVRVDTPGTTTEPFVLANVVQTVDQSIQPGDGGFGAVLDLQGFLRFGNNHGAGYVTGAYLINPENDNGVATYRGQPSSLLPGAVGSEAYMSVPDQYLYRLGATWFPNGKVGLSLGGRWEGIPVHDLIGESDGFRRPGYAISIEPGFTYTTGPHTFALSVPYAVQRNRQRSVPDLESGGAGDAAFADYVIIFGYVRRLGGKNSARIDIPTPPVVQPPPPAAAPPPPAAQPAPSPGRQEQQTATLATCGR